MLEQFNPFGPTGGNPMVKVVEVAGIPYWNFYKLLNNPAGGTTFELNQTGNVPNGHPDYNTAWNEMYNWYVNGGPAGDDIGGYDLPTFGMSAEGFTLGNPEVPGFTFNDIGLEITAETPSVGVKPIGGGP